MNFGLFLWIFTKFLLWTACKCALFNLTKQADTFWLKSKNQPSFCPLFVSNALIFNWTRLFLFKKAKDVSVKIMIVRIEQKFCYVFVQFAVSNLKISQHICWAFFGILYVENQYLTLNLSKKESILQKIAKILLKKGIFFSNKSFQIKNKML